MLGRMDDYNVKQATNQAAHKWASLCSYPICVILSLPVSDCHPPSLARSLSLAHKHAEDVSASLLPCKAAAQM